MESRSSESRSSEIIYGFDGFPRGHYNGYSSEFKFASESRDSSSSSLNGQSALESRTSTISSESRATSFSSESRKIDIQTPVKTQRKQFNSLEDIDKLIERLEGSLTNASDFKSERTEQILEQRRQKIELLKKLAKEAREAEAEKTLIKLLEQENSELDDAIDSINKGFHR